MEKHTQQNSKSLQKQRKKKMAMATYIGALAGLFVVGLLGVVIWLLNYSPNATVYTVNDYKFKRDLYTCVYFYDTMSSQAWTKYGFDPEKSPYEQSVNTVSDAQDFSNYGEYFEQLTNSTLRYLIVMNDTAQTKGFSFSKEVEKSVQAELRGIDNNRDTTTPFKQYMLENYGAEIRRDTLEEYLRLYYRANEFYKTVTESKALFNKYIGGDSSDFEKCYKEHPDEIDTVSFRYYYLKNGNYNQKRIAALKNAASEKEFQQLCNKFKNDEDYTQNDRSLYTDYSLKQMRSLSSGELVSKLSSKDCKAGDIYCDQGEIDGESVTEIIYVVKARGKATDAYNDSDVAKWEFAAMKVLLEDYANTNYQAEASEKGIEIFRKSLVFA